MRKRNQPYTRGQVISGILMLFALAWLTISLPFVNEAQQVAKSTVLQFTDELPEEEGNPLANTTEEKTESGVNVLSEYLHNTQQMEHHFMPIAKFYKCHPSDLYFEYHPELISPPPEV